MFGYIYVRCHHYYDMDNICKLGKTNNIPDRDSQYATNEFNRGYFESIYEVPIQKLNILERLLQYEFREHHVKRNGGIEFYNKQIIDLIEPYLMTLNMTFKKLTNDDISKLKRCYRVKNTLKKINIPSLIHTLKQKTIIPKLEQTLIIDSAVHHYQSNDKGLLILPCGAGKTLISLWITQKLNSNTIIIGVPNKLLLEQWKYYIYNIFPSVPSLIISSGIDIQIITDFLHTNSKQCIIVTTYSSSHKVYSVTQNISFIFDMKINDECHHLTTSNIDKMKTNNKSYIQMLNIQSIKQISLTATIKKLDDKDTISNTTKEYFGEIIDRKCLLWAINHGIICDYVIQTMNSSETYEGDDNDKRLWLSALASLTSISNSNSHHLLIYTNTNDNSFKVIQYIELLLSKFNISELYYSNYHSTMNSTIQKDILDKFEKSKHGIISCVYCLGEGWDFPLLDGVVFAENMTSNIRIIQCALRASRKNELEPNKITKIILPILNQHNWLENNDNQDLRKIKEVLYQMGLEDETISQKIKEFNIDINKFKITSTKNNVKSNINHDDIRSLNPNKHYSISKMYYFCDICLFNTNHLPNYTRHCNSKKHQRNILNKQITFSNYCELCNKSYICSDDEHKQFECKPIKKELTKKEQDVDISALVFQILEQNKELIVQSKDLMIQNKKLIGQLILTKPTVIYNNCVDNSNDSK